MPARAGRFDAVFYAPWIGPALAPGRQPPSGGAETQLAMLGRGLAARGYRVCFIALDTPEGLPAEIDGVAIRRIRRSEGSSPAILAWRATSLVARTRARVVVQRSASAETGMAGLVARALGRRFVYSSANVVDFDYGRLEPSSRNVRLFHLGVRLASEIVVQTEEQVAMCEAAFGRQPVLIKSIAAPAPAAPRSPDAFLWVGRLAHYKRAEDFLRLAEALPQARFRIVGVPVDAAGERALREQAAGLGNVEWLEPRPREQILPLMDSAVAIVNTSEYEGMPNVFLEGWARGVPALTLSHDPDGTVERERVGLHAGGDFHRFVAAARELWDARASMNGIAERCRSYIASQHDPEVVVDRWIDALGLPRP